MRWRIEYLDEVGSTNDAVRGSGEGGVVAAGRQTAGRGQRGNSWSSRAGENLTFSAVLEPTFLEASNGFLLSEAVALAVVDALRRYGIEAAVKWPNDIYIGARKVAGILIENDIRGRVFGRSVVGIGLNVNQTEFPEALPNPVSMRMATGEEYRLPEVLDAVLDALAVRYGELRSGHADRTEADYARLLYRRGVAARYALPDGTAFTGTIRGVSAGGELVMEMAGGVERRFLFKEVEFEL